jgi:conjugative relaxase-like TrwC/TraI family protein
MVRFDNPCIRVAGAVEYFREHMAVGDYLTQEGRSEMTWFGRDAARLDLSGVCDLAAFENLCRGRHPVTGDRLLSRDKGSQRRVCFFAQLSPPKDVSVLYLVGGDERIAAWWKEAVTETLHELEALTSTRVRAKGQNHDRRTGSLIAASVTHDANRALDPQLHTHVCVMNLTYDETEARWKSVQPSAFFRHQGYLREVCYNRLASSLRSAGYEIEPAAGLGFRIKGFPAELRDVFSKRRREILRRAAEAGTTSQDALQHITATSRAEKTNATAATLRSRWIEEAGPHLDTLRRLISHATGHPVQTIKTVTARDALLSAEAHVFERHSVADEQLLLREALRVGRGQVNLRELKQTLASRVRSGALLAADGEVASQDALEAEREITAWAAAQLIQHSPLGRIPNLTGLDSDQAEAVRELLSSTSGLFILQGDAGTGKTRSLRTVVAGIEQSGGQVFGCAPTAGAADVLRRELTPAADTLQHLLTNQILQQEIRGRVLLVDEAGLLSVRQLRDLCRLAARHNHRLLLVGDVKQHASVEAGDALRCLQDYTRVPVVHLHRIRRQIDPRFREAVTCLARGDAAGAFRRFDDLGAVRELNSAAALHAAAADDYVRTLASGKSCLAISPVWSEIKSFSEAVRQRLRANGTLTGDDRTLRTIDPFTWTAEERRRVASYRMGDVLTFHRAGAGFRKFESTIVTAIEGSELVVQNGAGESRRIKPRTLSGFEVGTATDLPIAPGERLLIRANVKPARLKNGDLVEVTAISADGAIVLKDGRTIPPWFRQFSHGYATTSHAAQGKTVDRGLLLMGEDGIAAGNLQQAYVSNSRFRETQMIYTTDKAAAVAAMERPADRKLALELIAPQAPLLPRPPRWQRWLKSIVPIPKAAA